VPVPSLEKKIAEKPPEPKNDPPTQLSLF
jgi:hypothetical protein